MKRQLSILLASALLCGHLFADDASQLTRMREALRNTMLQLRAAAADRDNFQAQAADLQNQKDALAKQLTDLTKRSAAEKDSDLKTINVLKQQLSDQQDSIASLQKSLDQWKAAQQKAAAIATETEAKRAKLAELAIRLQRIVDDQKRKNDAMYKIGMDVLDRYEKFGLGQALFAKEPFVGITRTKFETLIQDSEDKLTDQKITGSPTADSQPPKP